MFVVGLDVLSMPIAPAPLSENQMFPSLPTVIPVGPAVLLNPCE